MDYINIMFITVVELPEFIRRAEHILTGEEKNQLISYLSTHPKSGTIIQGTGGIRKIRWACKGHGKRGGARVIYFLYDENIPLFLLTIFSKSEKDDLSKAERNELLKFTKTLISNYKRKSNE